VAVTLYGIAIKARDGASRTSLRKIVDQRCARGRAIGRKLNVAADQERIEMGLTGLPAPAMFKLGN
jgi:hypothetical protein